MRRQNWAFVIICSRRPHNCKQVISRRRKNENVFKMSKDEKCTCKACKTTVFHCQRCKFVGFLLTSSSWLLKLPIINRNERAVSKRYLLVYFVFSTYYLPCIKITLLEVHNVNDSSTFTIFISRLFIGDGRKFWRYKSALLNYKKTLNIR